ncbi:MAG TPA: inositol monophosphatase family protein [Acidimicrobiales bacterium]|nr:inositol monophosphatase family protein [Acidimicrobiales bacterium]
MTFGPDLTLALELADVADAISMARFRDRDLLVETKPDLTPVTEVDHAVEEALRRRLGVARPGQAILGEEGGQDGCASAAAQRWIVDPIDGTKNYVRGVPVWATLIALQRDGRMVVGVVSAPALGRRWWAARGEGAWADGRAIRVSRVATVEDAFISYDGIERFDAATADGRPTDGRLLRLAQRCWRSRGLGDFWSHVLVAEGAVDIAAEPEVSLWDVAPVQVIVEEAGGRFTDLGGEARADGGSAVSTNGLLHEEVLAALR